MILTELQSRSENKCELCTATEHLSIHIVAPETRQALEYATLLCPTCTAQVEKPANADSNHWRCLNDSIWNTNPAVQVLAWRMLNHLNGEGWTQDLLNMMYIEEDTLAYANSGVEDDSAKVIHRDVNGVVLEAGDNVVLIKDLKVKGSSMIAKQGTPVRRISLDMENAEYIEGKVDGQQIVIITKYVKKTS